MDSEGSISISNFEIVFPKGSPYQEYTGTSPFSVIGSLSEYGISWDVNLGGEYGGLGSDFAVTQDGPNIKVGADGVYDVILNPAAGTAQLVETLGGGKSGKIGGNEPGPEPEPVRGWNIIGLNGDWENDILATADGNVYTAYISVPEATEFKWRLDGAWDSDFGGTFVALGEAFEAVPGGSNIKVDAGFWKVVLDTEALLITISDGNVWSLIGDFNEWGGDVDMTLVDGRWVSPETVISGGFKIRHNHDWGENVGGTLVSLGEAFPAVSGGDNISVEEGTYIVTYDPEAATITVVNARKVWSVIGVNGDWDTDNVMTEVVPGIWMSEVLEITSEGWKIRQACGWDVNRGGVFGEAGTAFDAVSGGDNINVGDLAGFTVSYDPVNEKITVSR